ncbi:hypothetical protein A9Q84_15295 [Halobacteriovorax marinus]|uniref:Anion transporter n=1 Tax=Halobacteriovorax marinus TaxID=97084 RepID=A0A1Y5F5C5_9BACT|nr:hypothetical protein A9Q84_15295 [Halobacteriovorax marinus]
MNKSKTIVKFSPLVILLSFIALQVTDPMTLTIFMMGWMVSWWIFEIMPLGITALIPLIYMPLSGVISLKEIAPQYSNPVIYLFLGGFIIARALEKTHLSERIALLILKFTGKSDKGIIIGFICATTFLSMWISNTATTVMMIPIALSVMNFLKENIAEEFQQYLKPMSVALFLGIAYSANIGGVMTPIGTPPNVVFIGYLEEMFNKKIEFYQWFLITAPTGIFIISMMFLVLSKAFPFKVPIDQNFRNFITDKVKQLGKINGPQKVTLSVFVLVAGLWIFKGVIHNLLDQKVFNDTSIALMGGVLLFLIPTNIKNWKPVLDQKDISFLPWDIVLLFGGGMAMAHSLKVVGLIQSATNYFSTMDVGSVYGLVFVLAMVTLMLTEIMSNVALCVVALPVIMNLGPPVGLTVIEVALPATLCASFAFSMPISTPPNAIVFGTNQVRVSDMMKAGIPLNIIGVGSVMTITWFLMKYVL